MKFKNTAKSTPVTDKGEYGYDCPSIYMFEWSRLFQAIISQAGSYLLNGSFHKRHTSIFKCEGGCTIDGYSDLVLGARRCYFDTYSNSNNDDAQLEMLAALITSIVINWNPNDPIDSMLELAATYINVPVKELTDAVSAEKGSNVFGGNALANFFDWNPFSDSPANAEYHRWCCIAIDGQDAASVDRDIADKLLGKTLKDKINAKCKKHSASTDGSHAYYTTAMCCSPRRDKEDKLSFWINTGLTTQLDGWKTEEDINAFLQGTTGLTDSRK